MPTEDHPPMRGLSSVASVGSMASIGSRGSARSVKSTRMILLNEDHRRHFLEMLNDSKHSMNTSAYSANNMDSSIASTAMTTTPEAPHPRRGILIAFFGTLLVTPDALLTRWARRLGANTFALVFWKFLSLGLILLVYTSFATDNFRSAFLKNPGLTLLLGALQSLVTLGISLGVLLTYAANAMLLYSLDPLWGAVMGWVFLGDVLPKATMLALFGAFSALLIIFIPAAMDGTSQSSTSIAGDIIALSSGLMIALYLTLLRWMFLQGKIINAVGANGVGHIAIALVMAIVAWGLDLSLIPPNGLFFLCAFLNGAAVSCVVIAFTIAPKYITGAHIGLISLLENIGPLWVWVAFGEQPPIFTLIGGAIVLIVIASHESYAIHQDYLFEAAAAEAAEAEHHPKDPSRISPPIYPADAFTIEVTSSPAPPPQKASLSREEEEEEAKGSPIIISCRRLDSIDEE